MTTFIAAYDTEQSDCLNGLRNIVGMHEKYQMPATFFVVAGLLDKQGQEIRDLLGNHPLFEIASHTYTHMLLRKHRMCGTPGPEEQFRHEIVESKNRLEDYFGQKVIGFRTPVGFADGLKGAANILALCHEAGYLYSSSLAWGPEDSLPALIKEAFTYTDQGYATFWEIPPCGWHENLLKNNNGWGARPLQLFPHPMPEAILTKFLETPEEEFEVGRIFMEKAIELNVGHMNLIWHPWSLHRFDPEMKMLDFLFHYIRKNNIPATTFAAHATKLAEHATEPATAMAP